MLTSLPLLLLLLLKTLAAPVRQPTASLTRLVQIVVHVLTVPPASAAPPAPSSSSLIKRMPTRVPVRVRLLLSGWGGAHCRVGGCVWALLLLLVLLVLL